MRRFYLPLRLRRGSLQGSCLSSLKGYRTISRPSIQHWVGEEHACKDCMTLLAAAAAAAGAGAVARPGLGSIAGTCLVVKQDYRQRLGTNNRLAIVVEKY